MSPNKQSPRINFHLLGSFHITYRGAEVTGLDAPRIQELLAYLLLQRDAPQSRQQIAFDFWPESSDSQSRTNLRQLLYRLRQELPEADRFLLAEGATLQWQTDASFQLDVASFDDALAQASAAMEAGKQGAVVAGLKKAVDLYQGELLPDCYSEWILPIRERLRRRYTAALERLTAILESESDYQQAMRYARRLLAQDDLLETNYRRLMRLQALSGNRAAAVRVYHNCVTVLERELGVAPGADTQQMYEQLMTSPSWEGSDNVTPSSLAANIALVGRQDEWLALQRVWKEASERPHLELVLGEAGIGKTRLAEQFVQWADRQGIATAAARCYPGEGGLAYAPIAAWLRADALRPALSRLDGAWRDEIARILPELVTEQHGPTSAEAESGSWQQQRFFDGLVRAFVALGKPLVLFLDDVQWADRATLAWLGYLLAAQTLNHVLLLCTVRKEEIVDDHPLNAFRWRLAAAGQLGEIELGPLSREQTIALARKTAGAPLETALAQRFYEETEGNPLFVIESARMLRATPRPDSSELFLSPRVQAVIEARLNQLSPTAREVAGLAATFNGQFSFELLWRAGDFSEEELVGALDELWRRRLVREVDEADYDFSHGKIREVAYAGLSSPRRQFLHRRLAQALEVLHAANLNPVSARIAGHYLRAGQPDRALDYYVRAADHAAGLYAYGEAEELYAEAIALATKEAAGDVQLGSLYVRRGRMLEHAGRFEEAVSFYRELQALAQQHDDRALAALALARLVSCYIEPNAIHDLQAAEPLIRQGLAIAHEIDDPALEADFLWSQMIRETHYGNTDEAQRVGERCLTIAREHGLERQLGYSLHDLALNLRLAGEVQRGTNYALEAQTIFRKLGNLPMLADSLNQKALMHILHLKFGAARECLAEARQVSERINNRWNLAYSSWLRGMIWFAQGVWDRALGAWQESLQQGEQVGFLTGVASVRLQQGILLRQLGDLTNAQARHEEAYEASSKHAPFLLPIAESELARDALAGGDLQAAENWLAKARARPDLGDIATGLFLSSRALAATEQAVFNGKWTKALEDIGEALQEARRRALAWHEAGLLVARGCCLLGLEKKTQAGKSFVQAVKVTRQASLRPLHMQAHIMLALHFVESGGPGKEHRSSKAIAKELAFELAGSIDDGRRQRFLDTPAVQAILETAAAGQKWPFPLFS